MKQKWQQLEQENRSTVNEMAINLIEQKKGKAYCKTIAKLFSQSPAHRAQIAPEYREALKQAVVREGF